jgi:pimeloyl-ACP methyl ester carboxylesterase
MTIVASVALPTGVTLPYAEHGDASGVPIILLHGPTDSWRSYELVLELLPVSVHAFALTQRGHGDADRPPGGYRPEDFAADAAAFMDAVGVDAAVVAGHSGASYTAQRFALAHPDRTLGLVLIGTPYALRDNPALHELLQTISELTDPIDPRFVREFVGHLIVQPVPARFLEHNIADSCKTPVRVWQATLQGLADADAPTKIGTITAPTLILWGDHDEICPRADQEALVAAIPTAQLVTYHGTGHSPHWEQPERVAADLAAFAQRVHDITPRNEPVA